MPGTDWRRSKSAFCLLPSVLRDDLVDLRIEFHDSIFKNADQSSNLCNHAGRGMLKPVLLRGEATESRAFVVEGDQT